MHVTKNQEKKLTIYISENDSWHTHALHEALVNAAREKGIAGALALKGFMSYGHNKTLHTTSLLSISNDLPIIVQIIDKEKEILNFLKDTVEMIGDNLVVLEDIETIELG